MNVDEPVDLETWRIWYVKIAVILGVIFFPLGLIASLPVYLADRNYAIIIIGVIVWFVLLTRLFSNANAYKVNAYTIFCILYVMIVCLFLELGPTHARPAWLVSCVVMAALVFGIRGAAISTVLNMTILIVLYSLIDRGNPVWAAEYSATNGKWFMFVVNISLLTLVSSLPVGFMLSRLDRSLRHEREVQKSLSEESEKLKASNIRLEKEIEQRRQAEEALRLSEEKYRLLVENIPSVTWITGEKGKTEFISSNLQAVYGLSPEDIYRHGDELWFGRIHPEDINRVRSAFQKMFDQDQEFDLEYRIQRMDGEWIWLHDKGVRAFEKNGTRYAYGVFTDVTGRKETEEKLRESEGRLKLLFENAPDGYILVDPEGRFLDGNKVLEGMLGYKKEELFNKTALEINLFSTTESEKAIDLFTKTVQGLPCGPEELIFTHKNGSNVAVEINAFPMRIRDEIQILAILRNITDRKQAEKEKKRLEDQLIRAQKMEAIGTLAGGIAHDFNNILMAIMGFADLALYDAGKGTTMERNLQSVRKAGARARELIKQILTFSRYGEHDVRPLHMKPVVNEVMNLIRATLPSTIQINQSVESNSMIMADPVQVHQILMNLCTNAGHAMMKHGGNLEVNLTDVQFDSAYLKDYPEMTPGPYIKLTVSDTGYGMSQEILDRIFDPYFTTKAQGEGTGLGLSVVHGIVKSYKGAITVTSRPGKGSTFNILLPVVNIDPDSGEASDESLPAGEGRVLLIDDEPILTEVGKQMLETLGYEVVAINSSPEAIELFRSHPENFDLVVTDMTMPIMTGEDLAMDMMKVRPDIPVILCTGFSHQINKQKAMQMGIKAFVMKPFVIREIGMAIRQALGKS